MMKNLILTLAFILTGTFAFNANASHSLLEELPTSFCIDFAFTVEEESGKELPYETFDAIVRSCEAISMREIIV